jgi:peroxiredoxin
VKPQDEIRQALSGFNLPAEAREKVACAMQQIERNRLAPGLEVGEQAPNFRLPSPAKEEVSLEERLDQGPVVVTFYRGAWCPSCNLQLLALERAWPEMRSLKASLIAISPADSKPGPQQTQLEYDVLTDADQKVIRDYKLQYHVPPDVQEIYLGVLDLDVSSYNSDGSWNLPMPGTFVIDQKGIIRKRHVTADSLDRMEPEDVMAVLKNLSES